MSRRSIAIPTRLSWLFVLVVTSGAARAVADESDVASLLRSGVELRRYHRNEEARAVFARALALSPTPIARAQLALSEQALGQWLEADRDLRTALLDDVDDTWIEKNRASLEDAREEIAGHLAWLTVRATPASAEVRVDGKSVSGSGAEVRIVAGSHAVEVRAAGYTRDARRLDIAPGDHTRVAIGLLPTPDPSGSVVSQEGASPPLPPKGGPRGLPTASTVLAAVAVVGCGVGTYFAVRTFDNKSARDAQCSASGCNPAALNYDEAARRSADVATVSFGVAAASIAAAAVWWFAGRSPPPVAARVAVAPLWPSGAGLTVGGTIE